MFVKGFSRNEYWLVFPGQGGGQDHHWEPQRPSREGVLSRGQEPSWFPGSGGATLSWLPPEQDPFYETHGLPLDLRGSGSFWNECAPLYIHWGIFVYHFVRFSKPSVDPRRLRISGIEPEGLVYLQ